MSPLLSGLNEPQQQAVTTTDGPLLILAGAGSGKTRCVTHRIAYLITEKKVAPENILAVTFTNKAASEMRSRLEKLIGLAVKLPWLGTFHSVCIKILRREITRLGMSPNFTIYDDNNSKDLIKKIMEEMGIDPKRYSPNAVKSFISGAKNELMKPDQYAKYAHGPFQEIVVSVYKQYQSRLTSASGLDFDDILMLAVELLEKEPEVLAYYQKLFKYVHVDEYQDTNPAQYKLVKLLGAHGNVCVVGDDFQAIYSWRGANFQNILDFEKDFPKATVIKLEQNYRSTKSILAAAQSVIEKNRLRSKKTIWTDNKDGLPIVVYQANDGFDEAEFVLSEIKSLHNLDRQWFDFVVLYRTNAQSRVFEDMCMKQNIPYRLIGALRFWERKEIKDVIAYTRFLYNPLDEISFLRIIGAPPRGVGQASLAQLDYRFLKSASEDFESAIDKTTISTKAKNGLNRFFAGFAKVRDTSWEAPAQIILELLETLEYKQFAKDGSEEGEARWENVEELLNVAATKESIAQFLEEAALSSDIDNYDANAPAITLMTIHNAKGLEFPIVFIVGMEEGLFPHVRSLGEPESIEEERRLFYVGMTRAKERLYLLFALSRMMRGGFSANLPSRFLAEVPEEFKEEL